MIILITLTKILILMFRGPMPCTTNQQFSSGAFSMSKQQGPILGVLFVLAAIAVFASGAYPQYLEATITIDPASAKAQISGKRARQAAPRRNLSFLASAIGAPNLGARISGISLKDAAGRAVPFRAFNSAEYVAEADFAAFSYEIDLKATAEPRSAAHVSWVGPSEGVLLTDDLLPQAGADGARKAILTLTPIDGWEFLTSDRQSAANVYEVEDIERSVFAMGKGLRQVKGSDLNDGPIVVLSGRWLFDDADAANMAAEIFQEYARVFGGPLSRRALVVLLPMPGAGVQKGTWEAETRGSTVLIASSDMAFKTQSLQRLHEQLRHEMFHLWMPNNVDLTGRYDWFYEGFALYQSLRTGVRLNRIRFDDLLDTLSRAHNIDRSQTRRRSLIEASEERWSGADTQLYARGMLVAFMSDLILLQGSNGKSSVEDLLRGLYSRHRSPAAASGANDSILKIFNADRRLAVLAADHIRGAKEIEWSGIIEGAGIENEPGTSRPRLRIKGNLTARQKTLLDKLGYNSWRKLTRK